MTNPEVSVVVSTFNRPVRLARMLDGLRAQSLPPERFEVVVVDDDSDPETLELLLAERERGDLNLRFAKHPYNQGQSAGRNTGWRMAESRLVAFTDDDCVPTPRWLETLVTVASEHLGAIIQGKTVPDPDESSGSMLFARTVTSTDLGPQFETCNIAYPRELLEVLGGFDTRYAVGEDTDLAWRALERGNQAVFFGTALVHHAVERSGPVGTLRDAVRWGDCARVFAAHPGARAILHRRYFWNAWHFLLARSLLVVPSPRWLRAIVWSRHAWVLRRRAHSLNTGSWAIPFLLAYDIVQTLAMVRGAIRHRTPLL